MRGAFMAPGDEVCERQVVYSTHTNNSYTSMRSPDKKPDPDIYLLTRGKLAEDCKGETEKGASSEGMAVR
jgi:hypothetical protein